MIEIVQGAKNGAIESNNYRESGAPAIFYLRGAKKIDSPRIKEVIMHLRFICNVYLNFFEIHACTEVSIRCHHVFRLR